MENDSIKGCEVLRIHCSEECLSTPSDNIPDQTHMECGDDLDTHKQSFILMQYELKGPSSGWFKTALCPEVFSSSLCFIHLEAHGIFPCSGQ